MGFFPGCGAALPLFQRRVLLSSPPTASSVLQFQLPVSGSLPRSPAPRCEPVSVRPLPSAACCAASGSRRGSPGLSGSSEKFW